MTDANLDAAGGPIVLEMVLMAAKRVDPRLVIVGIYKKPVAVDFGSLVST